VLPSRRIPGAPQQADTWSSPAGGYLELPSRRIPDGYMHISTYIQISDWLIKSLFHFIKNSQALTDYINRIQ
jgi:hypothetical protein